MVTRRIRHRTIGPDGEIIVKNFDHELGPGVAKMRVATGGAAPVGHMDAGSRKKNLRDLHKLSESKALMKGQPSSWRKSTSKPQEQHD